MIRKESFDNNDDIHKLQ